MNKGKSCRRFILLAISSGGSGLEEGTDQRLKPASPAPRSGSEALTHHRAVLVEERTKSLARNQDWSLRAKMTRYKNTGSLEKHLTGKKIHAKQDGWV